MEMLYKKYSLFLPKLLIYGNDGVRQFYSFSYFFLFFTNFTTYF